MPRAVSNFLVGSPIAGRAARKVASSDIGSVLDPGARLTTNTANGQPFTARNMLDPGSFILHAPPAAPPPPPTFPDVTDAQINARRNVRRRAISSGVGSTILTGGYSPTGQSSPILSGLT